LSEESVEKVLKNFGLTDTEAAVYISLAKHGVLKSRDIARQMKKDRAQTLRILKNLQTKGLVEATLEVPTRYSSVPFERVIDLSIKAKREEAALMEGARKELLDYWKKIGKNVPVPSLEKFVVIEGDRKIYPKIVQMTKETKNQASSILTVPDLVRATQLGLFEEVMHHPLRSNIQFRFLTEVSNQNVNVVQSLLKRTLKTEVKIKGRNPDLGLRLFPRMMARDNEEILLFIKPTAADTQEQASLCLWTTCKALVQSFSAVFEDLWTNSTDIYEKIAEIENGKPTPTTRVINDVSTALKTYDEIVSNAGKEIVIMTSAAGLIDSWKRIAQLKELTGKGVSVKIMAPVTKENWQAMRDLSNFCIVKHVPTSNLETTIVDGKHLFQSENQPLEEKQKRIPYFRNTFYTDDLDYVEKTENMLNDVWRNASTPSATTLDSIINRRMPMAVLRSENEQVTPRVDSKIRLSLDAKEQRGMITEKDILDKIVNAKKYPAENWPNDIMRYYGSVGHAVIHPPSNFNLPDILIWAMHHDKQSSFGASDMLLVFAWFETPKGHAYVPVACVVDNPGMVEFHKMVAAGTPSEKNVHFVRKDELQIGIHGDTFFAGWAIPIPLFPTPYVLPPSGILLEGHGKIETCISDFRYPSGVKVVVENNGFDAFVTYFHPASKYSGPQTDGRITRDMITTLYPP
jgi:sugar-specific transcriptional regulator TrmB